MRIGVLESPDLSFCCRSLASSIWAQASRSSKGTRTPVPPLVLLAHTICLTTYTFGSPHPLTPSPPLSFFPRVRPYSSPSHAFAPTPRLPTLVLVLRPLSGLPNLDSLLSLPLFHLPQSGQQLLDKGSIVRIKRPESYWFNECDTVVVISTAPTERYPSLSGTRRKATAASRPTNFTRTS